MANLKLYSLWVNWAQKQYKTQTSQATSEKEFYELLTSPDTDVTKFIFPKEVVWVSWKYSVDNVAVEKNDYVVVAAYMTTQARLKLYEYLDCLASPFCIEIQPR